MSKLYYHKQKGTKEEKIRLHKHEKWDVGNIKAFYNAAVGAMFAMFGTAFAIGSNWTNAWMIGVPVAIWYPLFCIALAYFEREIHIYE